MSAIRQFIYECPKCGKKVTVRIRASEVMHGCPKQGGTGNVTLKEKKA